MPMLPDSTASLLVRTHFGDDDGWQAVLAAIQLPGQGEYVPAVEPVSDPAFAGADPETVRSAVPPNVNGALVLFIADATTLTTADHPVLVVDLMPEAHGELPPLRCVPARLGEIEANLNLANMDWQDFTGGADPDGVFRGFVGF